MKIQETHIVPAILEEIRLQEYAVSIFATIQSRSGLKKAIKKGLILIDGQRAQTGDWIKEGQKIELLQAEIANKKIFRLDFEVLFEDEHIAVVHKPPGFPTSGNFFKTVENALPHNLKKTSQPDALPFPLPAHRLDNPTAGILICAKTTSSLLKLQKDLSERKIQKVYYALVHGKLTEDRRLDSEIEEKPSVTLIRPLKFLKIKDEKYTLVEAKPLTGKTHQIRIHLNRNAHPIVGDEIYGIEETGYFAHKNLYLFSGGVSFSHPVTKESIDLEIKLPKRFRNLNNYRVH